MKKKIKNILSILLLLIFFTCSFMGANITFCADTDITTDKSSQLEDKVASAKEGVLAGLKTTSELIELLKQRALLRVKAKRREQLLKVNLYSAAAFGYETNVNADSSNKGDTFHNEYVMLNWAPVLNKRLGLNASALTYSQEYSNFTDSGYLYNSFSSAVRLYPFYDGRLRLEPGVGYEILWYPKSSESSYNNIKYFLKTQNFLTQTVNLDLNFEFSAKEYDTKKIRNPSGVEQEPVREDERYTVEAGLTKSIGRYSVSLEEKIYKNVSNDLLQDLNDYYAFETSLSIAGVFLEDNRLYVVFTPNFERKNYKERQAIFMAEYDDRYNYRLAAYYTLTKNYTLSYRFDYWTLDSNNPLAEYKNVVNQVGISARF